MNQLNKYWRFSRRSLNCSLYQLQLKAYHILFYPKFKVTFLEIWKLHTVALNFVDGPFGITVNQQFRSKSGHSNEILYWKLINRILKVLFNEGLSGSSIHSSEGKEKISTV